MVEDAAERGSRDHAMRRCRLLSLSVCHHQTDELAEKLLSPSMPRNARPTGFFPISSSTFVWNVLSKDCTGDERHTRSFKDVKSDSRVFYRNNDRWVGCKDCSRSLSMRQPKRFDLVNTNRLVGQEKEGP